MYALYTFLGDLDLSTFFPSDYTRPF